eukprot:sb/3461624/
MVHSNNMPHLDLISCQTLIANYILFQRNVLGQFVPPDDGESAGGSCNSGEIEVDSSCSACSAGTESSAAECTACGTDLGTVATGSTSADACVTICTVPTVGFATLNPESRVENSGTVTVTCNSGYAYGGGSTANVACTNGATNNNFPASCRKMTITAASTAVKVGTSGLITCSTEASDSGTAVLWYKNSAALTSDDSSYTITTPTATENSGVFTYASTLTILNFAADDADVYSCKVDYADPILDEPSGDVSLSILDITLDPTAAIFKTAGEGVGLTCKLNVDTAYPTRSIAWTSDGETILDASESTDDTYFSSVLSMSSLTLDKTTGDDTQTVSGTFDLTVRGWVTNPTSQVYNTNSGDDLTVSCVVEGEGEATITWIKTVDSTDTNPTGTKTYDSDKKQTTSTLTFSSPSADDSGTYKCSADFSGTAVESEEATISVITVGISENPSAAAFLVDEKATLSCKVLNPSTLASAPTITWMRKVLGSDAAIPDSGSPLPPLHSHSTEYFCKATYTVDGVALVESSNTAQLYIREQPFFSRETLNLHFSISLELTTALPTSTLVKLEDATTAAFTCKYSGDEATGVTWSFGGSTTLPDGWTKTDNSYDDTNDNWETTLAATGLTKTSGGDVKCSFAFSVGSAIESTSSLVVHSIKALPAETISGDASQAITCEYSGTDEPGSVSWKVGGSVVSDSDTGIAITEGTLSAGKDRQDILTISGRTEADADKEITCTYSFTNPSDTLTATTKLIFRGMVDTLPTAIYNTGGSSVLSCSIGVGQNNDAPSGTTWTYDGNALSTAGIYSISTDSSVANGKFSSTLTISGITNSAEAAGAYTCQFTVSGDSTEYKSVGNVVVRLVTITPSDNPVYSYTNAEFKMTCTLDASDVTTGVTWSGPADVDVTGVSVVDTNNYILTLTTPTSAANGAYTCAFGFSAGEAGDKPSGEFKEVNINLVTMVSPVTVYTIGGGEVVTLTCEVTSPSQITLQFKITATQ